MVIELSLSEERQQDLSSTATGCQGCVLRPVLFHVSVHLLLPLRLCPQGTYSSPLLPQSYLRE